MRLGLRAWIAAAACWAVAASASAFERQSVDHDPTIPLWWADRTVEVRTAADTAGDLAVADVRAAVGAGLATWSGAGGCTDFELVAGPDPSGTATNLVGGDRDGENRVVWREGDGGWPDEVSEDALALTTLVYRAETGEILDADIDVNGEHHYWTATDEPGSIVNDAENTITHELGHLLGFAHTPDVEATMYGRSDMGELKKRDLAEDDIAAVCTVYPVDGPTLKRTGISRGMLTSGTTCALSPGSTETALPASLGALALLLLIGRRRRRRAAPGRG